MASLALKISLVFVVVVGETKLLIYVLRRLQGVIMFGYLRCLLGHQRSVYNTVFITPSGPYTSNIFTAVGQRGNNFQDR